MSAEAAALSPWALLGTVIAGLVLQAVVSFISSLIQAGKLDVRLQAAQEVTTLQIAAVTHDVADIKRKLGNGGEGVFVRVDVFREMIGGLSGKDSENAQLVKELRERSHAQAGLLQETILRLALLEGRATAGERDT